MLTIGSLFSGIGGFELGLEWAGLGPVLFQVEKDPFCRAVLEKHWPGVTRFDDVCTVGAAQLVPVDLICGGFPCQDISSAGTRKGLAGERSGLWREFARIVGELRPRWVAVENSGEGARWADSVASDLEQLGYEVLPCPLSAWAIGASHTRARVLLVAHADGDGEPSLPIDAEVAKTQSVRANAAALGFDARVSGEGARTPQDSRARAASSGAFSWGFEPDLVRAVHGIPNRVDRVAALGNAFVPQCAEVVGWVIRELAGLTEARS